MTPHINAVVGDYAETVLMPGDPIRAHYIAKTFLDDVKVVNKVRNCLGFTGYYKGKKISVQASGMGQPSIGIYSYELFSFYDVKNIVRIGTCGSFQQNVEVGDSVVAMTSSSESSPIGNNMTFCPAADYKLLTRVVTQFEKDMVPHHVGSIVSIDHYYHENPDWYKPLQKLGVLGVDMETYMLYYTAMRSRCSALTVNMVSDSLVTGKDMSSNDRVKKINATVLTVLNSL